MCKRKIAIVFFQMFFQNLIATYIFYINDAAKHIPEMLKAKDPPSPNVAVWMSGSSSG